MNILFAVLLIISASTTAANAMPAVGAVITAIASAIGVSATTVAVLGFNLVFSATMSLIQRAKMKKQQDGAGGIRTEKVMSGGTNSRSFILGRYATAGFEIAPSMVSGRRGGGTTNAYKTDVIAISDLPIQGVNRLIIDGEYTPLGSSSNYYGTPILGKFDREDGLGWFRLQNGTQTTADSFLLDRFSDYPLRPWTSAMVGRGMAYAVTTFRWDNEYSTSVPTVKFEVDGIKLYDPRKDSTAGGSGSHRLNNPATWEFTLNPAVMIYNILIGIPLGDGTSWGAGCVQSDLPLTNWAAAMNICDENVTLSGGGTEKRFRAGYEVFVAEDSPGDVIDELLLACAGQVVELGGIYKIRVGGTGLPVAFFTDDDFIVSKTRDFDPFPPINASSNTVNASFPHPGEIWASHDAPTRTNPTYVAQDGGEKIISEIGLNAVPYPNQVQRLMRAWLEDDRKWRSHNNFVGPYAFALEPLDVFEWSSNHNGYVAKDFEIQKTSENLRTVIMSLSSRETDPTDYDWQPNFELPDAVAPGGWTVPAAHAVPGFGVSGYTIVDAANKARKPAIRCVWDGDAVKDAIALKIMVRRTGTTVIVADKTVSKVTIGYATISEGLLPDTDYEVSAIYVVNRPVVASSWFAVHTPNVAPVSKDDIETDVWEEIEDIANSAGIDSGAQLPAQGTKPNQVFMLVPPGKLYRWNATTNQWTTDLYAGISPNSITMTEMAQSIQPPLVWPPSGQPNTLPTTKQSSEVLLFGGKLYRWSGTAYTAQITGADIPTGAITGVKIAENAISAGKIEANAITAGKIDAGAVTANSLAANSVTAGSIAAGAVGADQIAAQAIIASKLMVADFSNLVVNNWTGGDLDGWVTNGTVTIQNRTDSLFVDQGIAGNMAVFTGGDNWIACNKSTVSFGDSYYFEIYVRRSATAVPDGTALIQARWTLNDNTVTYSNVGVVTNTATNKVSNILKVPENAKEVSFWLRPNANGTSGMVFLARPTIRRANSGELQVDGSITANAISAGAVVASKIAAGAVVASKIAAGAIAAGHLVTDVAVITTAAQIKDLIVRRIHIGDNELYLPYNWSRSDYQITTSYNVSNKVTFVNHNITQFPGGAFNVSFNADMDALGVDDGCAGFDLLIDDTVVRTSRYGANAGGGGGGKVNIIMPVVMNASVFGSSSVNIKVRGWSFKWDNASIAHQPVWVRNITLTVSGGRK